MVVVRSQITGDHYRNFMSLFFLVGDFTGRRYTGSINSDVISQWQHSEA
jgi:hypothetical protein